eukprot:SAG11_NODE_1798_length_4246_cov_1.709670_1_plen_31_part_00
MQTYRIAEWHAKIHRIHDEIIAVMATAATA